jgi:hypothetical protein
MLRSGRRAMEKYATLVRPDRLRITANQNALSTARPFPPKIRSGGSLAPAALRDELGALASDS